jgi:2-methylcitrate dehydratase PrpD
MDQKTIDSCNQYSNKSPDRREFLRRLSVLTGGIVAANALLPLLGNNHADAEVVSKNDPNPLTKPSKYHGTKETIEAICDNILNTRFEDIDRPTVENTKSRIMDVFGDMIGGTMGFGNQALVRMLQNWSGKKEASIIGYGIKVPAANAAMANSIFCRSFDWEPLTVIVSGKRYPSHTSCTTVPTAITMGEALRISGKELITALIVGDDLSARLSGANEHPWNVSTQNRLNFNTSASSQSSLSLGTVTSFGATAIAGRLLSLNRKQLVNAFGVVLDATQGNGPGIREGATTYKMNQGTTARNGVVAALLAKGGWYAGDDPLFGGGGCFSTRGCDHPEVLTRELGKKFYVEIVFKPYPGGSPTHVLIDAALALRKEYNIDTDDIEEIIVHLSEPAKFGHYMRPYKVGDDPTADALFSYRFSSASALYRNGAISKYYTPDYIRDPKLQALIAKVTLGDSNKRGGAELELKMNDGRRLSKYVDRAIGDPTNPLSREFLLEKFSTQVEFSGMVRKKDAVKLVAMIDKLEDVDNVQDLVKLAVKR